MLLTSLPSLLAFLTLAGEARPKHAFLLECLHDQWRTVQLPLHSVRPFMWDTITLGAVSPPLDLEDTEALTAVLERKVWGCGLQL